MFVPIALFYIRSKWSSGNLLGEQDSQENAGFLRIRWLMGRSRKVGKGAGLF
jgi:hypothetical protein